MKKALLRLLFISLTSILWSVMIIFFLRFLGSQQTYRPLKHDLINFDTLQSDSPQTFYSIIEAPLPSIDVYRKIVPQLIHTPQKSELLKIDIYPTRKGEWVILSKKQFKVEKFGLKRVRLKSIEEIHADMIDPTYEVIPLENFLKTFPKLRLAVEVHAQHDAPLEKISALFEQYNYDENLLILSQYEGTLRELKKTNPRWLYGSSSANLVKLNLMASLFLETLITMDFDVFVIDYDQQKPPVLNKRLIKEINQRFKKVFVQNKSFSELKNNWLKPYVQGEIITRHTAQAPH